MNSWLERARELDAADPLSYLRDSFVNADPNMVYLKGNSLGKMPKLAAETVRKVAEEQWAKRMVLAWNEGWYDLAFKVGDKIGKVIGARPGETLVADSTTLNVYKLAYAALAASPDKTKIVTDALNFPSDLYALQSVVQQFGGELVIVPSSDGVSVSVEDIAKAIDSNTALVTLSLVCFKSGWLHNGARVTKAAHDAGVKILWDLSHAAGAVVVDLHAWEADLAIGCCYKYLSGGPGAPAFLYVRKDLQESLIQPLWGWFGQKNPFEFDMNYTPAEGISKYQVGTQPILSLSAIEPGVDLLLEAGLARVRSKAAALTEFFIEIFEQELQPLGFRLQSPRDSARRGAHVAMGHPEAYRIARTLIEKMNVIPDFRAPDNLRFGFAPLYTRFEDVSLAAERLKTVMTEKLYEQMPAQKLAVT